MAALPERENDEPLDLVSLAVSRPHEALQRARTILAGDPAPLAASVARQAIGLVLREYGDIDAAVGELRTARRLADPGVSASREGSGISSGPRAGSRIATARSRARCRGPCRTRGSRLRTLP